MKKKNHPPAADGSNGWDFGKLPSVSYLTGAKKAMGAFVVPQQILGNPVARAKPAPYDASVSARRRYNSSACCCASIREARSRASASSAAVTLKVLRLKLQLLRTLAAVNLKNHL